jgi:hypothetical protein
MVTRRKKRRKMGAGRMWKRKPKMAFPPSTRGESVTHSERKRQRKRRRKRTRKENVQCGESKRTTERAFVRMMRRRRENNAEEEEKQKKTEKTMRGRPTRLVTTKVPTIALKSKETNVACCGSG